MGFWRIPPVRQAEPGWSPVSLLAEHNFPQLFGFVSVLRAVDNSPMGGEAAPEQNKAIGYATPVAVRAGSLGAQARLALSRT